MTTGLSWCWAKVLDHHHHHFDCSRPLTGAPRACSDGQRSRRHGTHTRTHACSRSRSRSRMRSTSARRLPRPSFAGAGIALRRGRQLHGKGGGRISACRQKSFTNGRSVCVCGVVVDSAMQLIPHVSSHAPLPPSRLIASRFVSPRLCPGVASCHPMSCALTYCTYVVTARTAQAVLQSPNTMAGRQARFFRPGLCVIEASNSSIHPIHYTTRGPYPVWRGPSRTTHGTRFINLSASPTAALRLRAHQPPPPPLAPRRLLSFH